MQETTVGTIIAVIGTLTGALGGSVLNGRLAARNAVRTRRFDSQIDTYVEAMTYTRQAKLHIASFFSPDTMPERGAHHLADSEPISARLAVLAPNATFERWEAFTNLYWKLFSEVMTTEMGSTPLVIDIDDERVHATLDALRKVNEALRKAAGTSS